jgi:hypothetical protein|tara:strand:- start:1048 stop:1356 length:309 start_codon:yes stop_codon:yes gene_type:complete
MLANQYSELLHLHMLLELLGILFHSGLFGYYCQELGKKMIDKKQKYIITLLVDNREWNSQPIEGKLGDLQTIIDEALEQHRISRFFTIRPKSVEFKRATLLK